MISALARIDMRKLVCLAAILIGYALAGVSVFVNARQGSRMSIDADGSTVNSLILLGLSTGPVLCMSFAGIWWREKGWRSKVRGFGAFVLALPLVTVTIWNAQEFMGDQMLGKIELSERRQTVSKDIAEIKNQETIRAKRDAEKDWWRLYTTTKDANEKRRLEGKLEEIRSAPLDLVAPNIEVAATSARSSWMAKKTGWDKETVQAVVPTLGPILMALVELFFPLMGFSSWPSPSAQDYWRDRPPKGRNPGEFPEIERKPSAADKKKRAREDVIRMKAVGEQIGSNLECAARWGVVPGTSSKWLREFESDGLIDRKWTGRTRAVVPSHNGNGMAKAAIA